MDGPYETSPYADDAFYADAYQAPKPPPPPITWRSHSGGHRADCPCVFCYIGRGHQQPTPEDYADAWHRAFVNPRTGHEDFGWAEGRSS